MPKKPEPWWREDRQAWFVQIDRKRHNLGSDKKEAWQKYYELMAQPAKRVVRSESLLAITCFSNGSKRTGPPTRTSGIAVERLAGGREIGLAFLDGDKPARDGRVFDYVTR